MAQEMEIILRNAQNKVIGVVMKDELYKRVNSSKHFLHVPPAIAVDESALEQAESNGASIVHVWDKDKNRDYYALISTIKTLGFHLDRGFGKQVALALSYWEDKRPLTQQIKLFDC